MNIKMEDLMSLGLSEDKIAQFISSKKLPFGNLTEQPQTGQESLITEKSEHLATEGQSAIFVPKNEEFLDPFSQTDEAQIRKFFADMEKLSTRKVGAEDTQYALEFARNLLEKRCFTALVGLFFDFGRVSRLGVFRECPRAALGLGLYLVMGLAGVKRDSDFVFLGLVMICRLKKILLHNKRVGQYYLGNILRDQFWV